MLRTCKLRGFAASEQTVKQCGAARHRKRTDQKDRAALPRQIDIHSNTHQGRNDQAHQVGELVLGVHGMIQMGKDTQVKQIHSLFDGLSLTWMGHNSDAMTHSGSRVPH